MLIRDLEILLEGSLESLLLGGSLEATTSSVGGGIDPLELDLLESTTRSVSKKRLTEGHDTTTDTGDGSLDENKVVLDITVVDESSHGRDGLLGAVKLGGGVSLIITLSNTVDLVVDGSSVVVTVLTGTGNSPLNVGRMPCSNTGDLTETSVGLSGELLGSPSGGNTLVSETLGDGNDINHLILLKDGRDINGLLKLLLGPVNLVLNGTTVNLDLSKVSLALSERNLADLSVSKNTDNSGVVLDLVEVLLNVLSTLRVLLGVGSESLLLGLVPVLVEATLDIVRKVLSPHGGDGSHSSGGVNVSNNTNGNHGGSVNDSASLNNLTLVHLGSTSVKVSDGGGHTGLVTKESSEVDGLGLVILGESLNSSSVAGSALAGQKSQGSVSGFLVLSMRHVDGRWRISLGCKYCLVFGTGWVEPQ